MATADKLQTIIDNTNEVIVERDSIAESIRGKGVTVPVGAKLNSLAGYADQIEQGGGGGGGSVDREGLALLGYNETEIDMFQEVCGWSAEDDIYYRVPDWNRALAGVDLATLKASHVDIWYMPKSAIEGKTSFAWRDFVIFKALRQFVSTTITAGSTDVFSNVVANMPALHGFNVPLLVDCSTTLRYCSALKRLAIPSVNAINTSGFEAVGLPTLSLPLLKVVNNYTFKDMTSLVTLELGDITSIGTFAFQNCVSLQTLDLTACTAVPALANINAFTAVSSALVIRVPAALLDAFKVATNWSIYADKFVGV